MFESVPRLKELVRLVFGEDEVVPPGIVLGNDRPEWLALGRVRLWGFFAAVGAGVGRPQIDLANEPAVGGTLIIVVTTIKVTNAIAGTYTLRLDAAQAGAPTANLSRDP